MGRGATSPVTHFKFFSFFNFCIMSDGPRFVQGRNPLFYSIYSENTIYEIFIFDNVVLRSLFFFLQHTGPKAIIS